MFLKFSRYKCVIEDHALVVHFHLCSDNGDRTSDGHYLHLNQIAQQMNSWKMVFRTPFYVLWGVLSSVRTR